MSKAMTAFSLATVGLANFAVPLPHHLGIDFWRLRIMFTGSALFILGYALALIRMPSEFQGVRDLHEIVDRMSKIHDYNFFKSRLGMTESLLRRLESRQDSDCLKGPIQYAKIQISLAQAKGENDDWKGSAASLYHADVALRQYDRPAARAVALLLLAVGILILLIPTVVSVLKAIFVISVG